MRGALSIHVPLVAGGRQPAADLVGKHLAELQRPLAHGLVADDDAACGQHSSTLRKLSGKRKYSQTAWLMISAGNR